MLESIYRAAGLRVGLFTSPHLVAFGERIQVNRQPISEADVARLVAELRDWMQEFPEDSHPTFFEVITVMALRYFAEQKCDLVIWETGLGGRLDATNIVTPLASVITNIQFDHQQWLGDTLDRIATEKAGIIKPGVPLITAVDDAEAFRILFRTAHEKSAPFWLITWAQAEAPPLRDLRLPLPGEHQRLNAAVAIHAVKAVAETIPVDDQAIREGLLGVNWAGRLQLVERAPGGRILLDGAHNTGSAEALRAALKTYFPTPPPTLLLGILKDKDWQPMCRILAPLAPRILVAPVNSPRTVSPGELAAACREANPAAHVIECPSLVEALIQAETEPFLLITGSLYLIGEAMELLNLSPANALNERNLNHWNRRREPAMNAPLKHFAKKSAPGLFLLLPACLLYGCMHTRPNAANPSLVYPVTAKTNQVDDYHGTRVADPYRWLEDDNSAATKAWVEAENKVTFGFLEKIPQRAAIKERLTQLWNYERFGVPFKEGGRYFLTRNDGLQNQAVLYTLTALNAEPALLLDPNTLSADGTVALAAFRVSNDGNLMAYGLSRAGSDWEDWRVRDVRTGRDLPDEVNWVKFSAASWTKDNLGFFYSRYDEPGKEAVLTGANYYHKLYYHRLGTPQSADVLTYQRPDHKDWGFSGEVTDDGRYLIIDATQGTDTRNRVFYRDLQNPGSPVTELLTNFDAAYQFIDNVGTLFYFRTDLDAPFGRVIAIDAARPERANWREVIPQTTERLQAVSLVNDQFIADYLKDAHSQIKIYGRDGRLIREVTLPGLGTAAGFGGKRADTETFYSYTSFTTPGAIYHYDLATGTSAVFRQPKVRFNPDDYETKQIFYRSKDGTRVPMFITAKKGLKLDGDNPTYLYGYGGFDISVTPAFSPATLDWMEMGGVYGVATLRGGGEYGEAWHQGGMKLNKQNVFDDFIAAAEWLTANHYTRRQKLAIGGASNGGLLVGACLTQRPDLYGATLPSVGVMDMLRFQKFTIGWAWTSDYGSSDDPAQFKALYAYSPLQNIKPGTRYPATLITTGDHDDRVVPAHSFKFAATLQAAQAGPAPILIRIETRAGHGAGKPTSKQIEEAADKWAFLVRELHMDPAGIGSAAR